MTARISVLDDLDRLGTFPAWLTAVTRPEMVRSALAEAIPEFRGGNLTLVDAKLKRARLEQGAWASRFELSLAEPEGTPRGLSLAGAVRDPASTGADLGPPQAALGEPGWRCEVPELGVQLWTPPPDAALPALPILSDPERSRELLERGIREGSSSRADLRIRSCTPKLVRYKPGSRCTFVYRLEYHQEDRGRGWPEVVVAKTYRGRKGRNAHDGMRALWDSGLGTGEVVTIAEPLAFIPEHNVLVQAGIGEDMTLKTPIRNALERGTPQDVEHLRGYIRQTANGLAALHRSGVRYGELLTWEDELAEVRQIAADVALAVPELAGATDAALAGWEAGASARPPQPPGPAHRSFRPAQVLIHRGSIGFIDFDGFCQCEPAVDVALFRASLRQFGAALPLATEEPGTDPLSRRLDSLDELCDQFLRDYEAVAPIDRERVALWEALDLLTNLLNCWVKLRVGRLTTARMLLERHVLRGGLQGA